MRISLVSQSSMRDLGASISRVSCIVTARRSASNGGPPEEGGLEGSLDVLGSAITNAGADLRTISTSVAARAVLPSIDRVVSDVLSKQTFTGTVSDGSTPACGSLGARAGPKVQPVVV
jgi:hypothetical protein